MVRRRSWGGTRFWRWGGRWIGRWSRCGARRGILRAWCCARPRPRGRFRRGKATEGDRIRIERDDETSGASCGALRIRGNNVDAVRRSGHGCEVNAHAGVATVDEHPTAFRAPGTRHRIAIGIVHLRTNWQLCAEAGACEADELDLRDGRRLIGCGGRHGIPPCATTRPDDHDSFGVRRECRRVRQILLGRAAIGNWTSVPSPATWTTKDHLRPRQNDRTARTRTQTHLAGEAEMNQQPSGLG